MDQKKFVVFLREPKHGAGQSQRSASVAAALLVYRDVRAKHERVRQPYRH
jgi:hypothetical protein